MSNLLKILFGIWIIWATFLVVSFVSIPPVPYEHQVDVRKREYYPAIVVDKQSYQSCSKRNCSNDYYVTIEREDKTYDREWVTEDVYVTHNIGDTISFERNITDPKVYNHWDNSTPPFLLLWLLLFPIYSFVLLVKWAHS